MAEKATSINFEKVSDILLNTGKRVTKVREWGHSWLLSHLSLRKLWKMFFLMGRRAAFFFEFRPWSLSEWSKSKKVWIVCLGLQPFA